MGKIIAAVIFIGNSTVLRFGSAGCDGVLKPGSRSILIGSPYLLLLVNMLCGGGWFAMLTFKDIWFQIFS